MKPNSAQIVLNLIEQELNANRSQWHPDAMFFKIKHLSIDQRGRVGELFLKQVFDETNKDVVYDQDHTGDYDLIIDGIKVEIKLATLDVNRRLQYEGIRSQAQWDCLALIAIAPDAIKYRLIKYRDFKFENDQAVVNLHHKQVHLHNRNRQIQAATGVGFKLTLKWNDLKPIDDEQTIINDWDHLWK